MWRWSTIMVLLCLLYDFSLARQSFVREPSDQYVREGQTVVLPCQVSDPVGQVQWTRDEFGLGITRDLTSYPRYQMIGDDHEGIFSLEIQRATMEDDGLFQCQVGSAAGQQGIRSRDARLTILVPPEPPRVIQGDQVSTTAGMDILLQCESRGGKPPAEIEWYLGDGQLVDNTSTESVLMADGKRSVVRSTLLLTAAASLHDTRVTCRVHNAALSAPQTVGVHLRVTFAPQVSVTSEAASIAELDDVTLHCRATGNPAQVRYRWLVNGEPVLGATDSSKTLRAVGRHLNNATVVCQVTNDVGTGSGSARIVVLYSPRFRSEPRDVAVDVGHQATLVCDVDASPQPRVTWVKLDCPSCPEPVGAGRTLTLTASATTVGLYECRTSADHHASVSGRVRLFVREAPRVRAPPAQRGTAGQLVHLECNVASVPPPTAVTWLFNNRPVPLETSSCAVVEEEVAGGVRSLLVIPDAEQSDFGLYNCSATNAYGSDSALIILEQQDDLPLLVIVSISIGGVIIITTITLVVILCQRHHRKANDVPQDTIVFDKSSKTTDVNSSDSDLKVEIRTSSSGSGQVITDRWDDPQYPSPSPLHDDTSDVRAFPPFAKDTMPTPAAAAYPPCDQDGYLHKSGGHQRMLHASTPIEFASHAQELPQHRPGYYSKDATAPQPQSGYYPPDATAPQPQPAYYVRGTTPPQSQPGYFPSRAAPPHGQSGCGPPSDAQSPGAARASYVYSQRVSDSNSSSQSRLSGPPHDEAAASAATGRSSYYESEARRPPLRGSADTQPAGRRDCRSDAAAGSLSRARTVDVYGEPPDGLQLKSGSLATPV